MNTGTPLDGQLKLKDDMWGCGANLGILVKPREGTRIGLTCLSPVKLDSHLEILTLDALAAAQDTAERDSTPTITLCPRPWPAHIFSSIFSLSAGGTVRQCCSISDPIIYSCLVLILPHD